MNKLHVKSAQRNQADILEVLENLASQEDLSDKVTTEQMNTAIALAVAGRLPVYYIDYDTDLDNFFDGINSPFIMFVPNDNDFDIEGYSLVTVVDDRHIYGIVLNNTPTSATVSWDFSWNEGDTFNDIANNITYDKLATKGYVDTNKGTKLYKHTIEGTANWGGGTTNLDFSFISTNRDKCLNASYSEENILSILPKSNVRYQGGRKPILGLSDSVGNNLSVAVADSGSVVTTTINITDDTVTEL